MYKFFSRYYDIDQSNYLSPSKLYFMVKDANPSWSDLRINQEISHLLGDRLNSRTSSGLTYSDFVKAIQSELDTAKYYNLCRSPKSILNQICTLLSIKNEERIRLADDGVLRAKRATKGSCWSCRVQQYEFANHCITIDTAGRCVEPNIILKQEYNPKWDLPPMSRSRYSLEYVFTIGSIPNLFIDLVRDFAIRQQSSTPLPGLLVGQDESGNFVKYLRLLCKELYSMLSHEEKYLKVPAPAVVVGDLQGSLQDLLQLERMFFQSFPILAENLIFLGT